MNNQVNNIIPIKNDEINVIKPIINTANENNNNNNNSFITSLPDWDLLPPYSVIKRVVRK